MFYSCLLLYGSQFRVTLSLDDDDDDVQERGKFFLPFLSIFLPFYFVKKEEKSPININNGLYFFTNTQPSLSYTYYSDTLLWDNILIGAWKSTLLIVDANTGINSTWIRTKCSL